MVQTIRHVVGLQAHPGAHSRKFKFLPYAGGSCIDVGASQLIIDGHIKVKQGAVARTNPHSLLQDDGTELPALQIKAIEEGITRYEDL